MLERLPSPCTTAAPATCPAQRAAELRLTEAEGLHLYLGALGAFGLSKDRPLAAGAGVQLYATYHRLIMGGHFLFFPGYEEQGPDQTYTKVQARWVVIQAEGGYLFPFRTSLLYVTTGIGGSADRLVYHSTEEDIIRERMAFVWSLGTGLEAMANRWLSVGVGFRFGLAVGDRANKAALNNIESGAFPFGTIWGALTVHL
jgi:hypothetical protein